MRYVSMVKKDCEIKHLCPTQFCDTCKEMDKYEFETELYMIVGNAKASRNPKHPHLYTIGQTFGRICDRCNNENNQIWCSDKQPKNWHWAKGWTLVKVKVSGVIKNPDKK